MGLRRQADRQHYVISRHLWCHRTSSGSFLNVSYAWCSMTSQMTWYYLGPRRFTNVFDESKINRIRIFAMLWTEYNDSFVRTKYPSDNRSTQRGNPVIYIKLPHRTIHLLFSIAFSIALTFIMLFIFNLIPRPSLFIRFSPSATAPFPNACNE